MTSNHIAYLALLTSIVSIVLSFLAFYRDRHIVRARADTVIDLEGVCHLTVSVSNSGKRPISIDFVLIFPPGRPEIYVNFSPNNQNRVDVGESRGCQISPINLPITWSTVEELHSFKIYVEDAVGKLHRANFQGDRTPLLGKNIIGLHKRST